MAGEWLPPAQLTGSGRPVLHHGEIESSLISNVDLECEDNASFPLLKSGLLILTTHRLIWIQESASNSSASAIAVSIPLVAITHIYSTKKSIKSMFSSPRIRFAVLASPEGRVDEKGSRTMVITLVMRGKADIDTFVSRFWDNWRARSWETSGSDSGSTALGGSSWEGPSGGVRMPVVGVAGILRKEQEMWESTDKSLQEAFQDLNALMSKAKEMVMLAEKMRQKLLSGPSNQTNSTNDEEMGSKQEMQDWLLSVGIASPVTKESAGALYHQQLSRQKCSLLSMLPKH